MQRQGLRKEVFPGTSRLNRHATEVWTLVDEPWSYECDGVVPFL